MNKLWIGMVAEMVAAIVKMMTVLVVAVAGMVAIIFGAVAVAVGRSWANYCVRFQNVQKWGMKSSRQVGNDEVGIGGKVAFHEHVGKNHVWKGLSHRWTEEVVLRQHLVKHVRIG